MFFISQQLEHSLLLAQRAFQVFRFAVSRNKASFFDVCVLVPGGKKNVLKTTTYVGSTSVFIWWFFV